MFSFSGTIYWKLSVNIEEKGKDGKYRGPSKIILALSSCILCQFN